jgi:hypothetical protein
VTLGIDFIKLKAAAEHLEWVLRKFPESDGCRKLRTCSRLAGRFAAKKLYLPQTLRFDADNLSALHYSNLRCSNLSRAIGFPCTRNYHQAKQGVQPCLS